MSLVEPAAAKPRMADCFSRLLVILRQPGFRWFWLGSSTQSVAQATQFLAIGWLVLEVTGSSAQLGLVIFLYGVPNVAFLIVAGVLADRFDRRYVLIITQAGVAGLIAALGIPHPSRRHCYTACVCCSSFTGCSPVIEYAGPNDDGF